MFAAIFIPDFSLQAVLRHEPDSRALPVALVDSDPAQKQILQVNAAARNFSVAAGLTPAQATARCGHVIIKVRSLAAEKSAGEVLLQTAFSFSPHLEDTAPGICTADLKGLGLITSSAQREWAEKIVQSLALFHLTASVGLAVTPALALLAAHEAKPVAVIENIEEFVAHLPIASLAPPVEIAEVLARWGIRRVGELLALGRGQLIERLGPPVLSLYDAVSPDAIRPLQPASPPVEFAEEMDFEHKIETVDPLLFVLRRFVEQLAQRLQTLGLVVAEFQLRLALDSGARYERVLKIPAPTGRVDILFRMLQTHLETVRTDAPIISLRLAATPTRPEAHQFGLFESTLRDPHQFAETLARLSALCGSDRVGTPVPTATHKPDTFQMRPPNFDSSEQMNREPKPVTGPALRRLRPPPPVFVEMRDGKPVTLHGGDLTGPIAAASGPFLGSGDWWDREHWKREEWDVETRKGAILRVFRAEERWFVAGVYD